MHLKWNNSFSRVLASSVAVFMAATSLYAIPRGPCDVPPPPVCCEEPKPGPFAFAYPYDVNLNCPRDFYVHADFLAFQAKEDGLDWAIQNGSGSVGPIVNGKTEGFSSKNDDWGYNFGARFGVGFYLNHDAWNLELDWTWLNIHEYRSVHASTSGTLLIPMWILGEDTETNFIGQYASGKWSGSLNAIDAILGKPFYISRYVVVNPFFGLRGAWVDQHYSAAYSGFIGNGTNRITAHNDNDFWGLGTRAGINTDWIVGKGWSFFGNVSSCILFGKFDVEQHLKTPPTVTYPTNVGFDIEDNHYMNVPEVEMAVGISWGQFFNKMKYHIDLRAAYEFQIWYDQLNLRKFFGYSDQINPQVGAYPNDTVSRGNLSLNGFSFRLQLDI